LNIPRGNQKDRQYNCQKKKDKTTKVVDKTLQRTNLNKTLSSQSAAPQVAPVVLNDTSIF
jgi:hypothetical protein